ncbi:hypothetical protein [Wolbachia endosymbiont of Dactylopius coccus]
MFIWLNYHFFSPSSYFLSTEPSFCIYFKLKKAQMKDRVLLKSQNAVWLHYSSYTQQLYFQRFY